MKKVYNLMGASLLSLPLVFLGCSIDKPVYNEKSVFKDTPCIEGVVINEEMIPYNKNWPTYPYAFVIETKEGKVFSYKVDWNNAMAVDAKINVGDSIAIEKRGICGGHSYQLLGASYLQVIGRALSEKEFETP